MENFLTRTNPGDGNKARFNGKQIENLRKEAQLNV